MLISMTVDLSDRQKILSAINRLYAELNDRYPDPDFLEEDRRLMDLDYANGDPWTSGSTTDPSFRGGSHA